MIILQFIHKYVRKEISGKSYTHKVSMKHVNLMSDDWRVDVDSRKKLKFSKTCLSI